MYKQDADDKSDSDYYHGKCEDSGVFGKSRPSLLRNFTSQQGDRNQNHEGEQKIDNDSSQRRQFVEWCFDESVNTRSMLKYSRDTTGVSVIRYAICVSCIGRFTIADKHHLALERPAQISNARCIARR